MIDRSEPCKYFRLGNCHRGNKCWYAHDKSSGRSSGSSHYGSSSSSSNSNHHHSSSSTSHSSKRGSPSSNFSRSSASNNARSSTTSSYKNSSRRSPSGSNSRGAMSHTRDRSSTAVSASSDSSRYPANSNSSSSTRTHATTSSSSSNNSNGSRGLSSSNSSTHRSTTPVTSFTSSKDPRTSGSNNSYSSHRTSSSTAPSNSSSNNNKSSSSSNNKSSAEPTRSTSSSPAAPNGSKQSAAPAKPAEGSAVKKKEEEPAAAEVSTADTKAEDPNLLWNGGAWGEAFLEGVAKCEGTSGKKLYLYGISSTRCPTCRNRVKLENDVCENCEYKHQRAKTCKMCALIKPSMWCYECDAYFCEACHLKPHVLVLGGDAPARHSCFAIEGASGRLHGKSAWSMDFGVMVKNVFRLRVGEKIAQAEAVSVSIEKQPVAAPASTTSSAGVTNSTPVPTVTAATPTAQAPASTVDLVQAVAAVSLPQQPPQKQQKPINGSAGGSESEPVVVSDSETPASATSIVSTNSVALQSGENGSGLAPTAAQVDRPPSSGWFAQNTAARSEGSSDPSLAASSRADTGSPSRKRKLSEAEAARIPPAAPAAQPSLFEKVRLMHEQKARLAHQQQQASLLRQQQQAQQQKQRMMEQHQQLQQQRHLQERQLFQEQQQAQQQEMRERLVQRQQQVAQQQQEFQQKQQERQRLAQLASQNGGLTVAAASPVTVPSPVASTVAPTAEQVSQTGTTTTAPSVPSLATTPSPAAHQPPSPSVRLPPPQQFQQVPSLHQYQQQQHQHFQSQPQHNLQQQQQQQQQQLVVAHPSPSHNNSNQIEATTNFAMPAASSLSSGANSASVAIPIVDLSTDNSTLSATLRNSNYPDASSNMDDPLKFAVVQEYDQINTYALHLEARNAKLNEHVRQISMQNVTTAAKLNEQIKVYRTALDQVYERRFEALAKVIMFSPDVRSRVKKIDQSTLGDIPHVLTACNIKCAQLAASIKTCESNVQNLRSAIDAAISSGDPEKLGQLHLLGKQISSHEQRIQSQRFERDDQFVLMIQYSRKLREVVRHQAMQNAKAKAPKN